MSFAAAGRSSWSPQRGVLVVIAGVASAFWVVIAVGFRLNNQRAPAEINAGLAPETFSGRLTGLSTISIRMG